MGNRRTVLWLLLAGALTLMPARANLIAGTRAGPPGGDGDDAPAGDVRKPTGRRAPSRDTRDSSEAPAPRRDDGEDGEKLPESYLDEGDDGDTPSSKTSPEALGEDAEDQSLDPYDDDGTDGD